MVRPLQGDCSPGREVRPHTSIHPQYKLQQLTNPPPRRWAQDPEFKDKTYFAKFDVDAVPDLAQELGIRAMPTFTFFKDGEKVDEFLGANPKSLLNLLQKHNPEQGAEAAVGAEAAEKAEGSDKAESPKPE